MKSSLFCGASVVAMTVVASLWSSTALAAAAAAEATPAAASPETTVGELVVTAEKRSERLQTVPVAVSAYTGEQLTLMGIATVQDLTDVTPGLYYSTYDNRPYIRGIGRQTDNLAIESGVAVYSDGVYNGANASTILQLDSLFIDRIEVLRGPQSTLYGRNADGGSINYISRRPTKDYYAEVRAGYSSYNKYFVEGAVSGPITDWLRFRLAANETSQTGGFYTNLNGSPEGGSVAQGGNGKSFHVEGQLEGNVGDKFDFWVKAATSQYNVSFHTQTLVGPLDTREFYDALMPNQNYGLCALPGGNVGLGCAGSPDTILPGSVVTLPNTIVTNPSSVKLRNFDADFASRSREQDNAIVATSLTYHFPTMDLKYLFGYQEFYYDLNAPWLNSEGISSSVEQYTLEGPPGLGNLVVNPANTQFTFIEDEYFYSNELDLTSSGNGPVQWIAGLYWYHEHYNQPINVLDPSQLQVATPVLFAPFLAPAAPNPTKSVYNEDTVLTENSYGVFGQVDWKISNTIKLTGGLRYTDDNKSGEEHFRVILFNFEDGGLGVNTFGAATPAFDATSCPTGTYPGAGPCTINPATGLANRALDASWDAVTGVANLAWTPDPETLAYAKYSRGYKTGGFNSGYVFPYPETLPETVNAFEIGLKKTFAGQFQLNGAAYYYDYQNDQQPLNAPDPTIPGAIDTLIFNIPTVHTYGVELETVWNPIRDLTLSVNYTYLHATIASTGGKCFEDTADPLALAAGADPCPASQQTAPGVVLQSINGATVPQSPANKVSFNALYSFHFEPGTLTLSGTFQWRDYEYDNVFNRVYNESPSYTQVNLRATWTSADNRYSVIGYVNNLFNTDGYDAVDGLAVTNPGPNQAISQLQSLTPPRTLGVEVQYRFK